MGFHAVSPYLCLPEALAGFKLLVWAADQGEGGPASVSAIYFDAHRELALDVHLRLDVCSHGLYAYGEMQSLQPLASK